jgi:hypothetical protein
MAAQRYFFQEKKKKIARDKIRTALKDSPPRAISRRHIANAKGGESNGRSDSGAA